MKSNQSNKSLAILLAASIMFISSFAGKKNFEDSSHYAMTIVFVDFDIVIKSQGNQLNWTTILESNLAKYEIQRSSNNQPFVTIGKMDAKGSGSQSVSYSFMDDRPLAGKNIYRLKMIDTRNGFQYSANKMINVEKMANNMRSMSAYPNPVKSGSSLNINLNDPGQYLVTIFSLSGKVIYSRTLSTAHVSSVSIQIPAHLTTGTYFLKIAASENDHLYQQKIIIQ